MKTEELINAIAADMGLPGRGVARTLWLALIPGLVAAFLLFMTILGPRPDIAAAAGTMRFPLKFLITLVFAAAALPVVIRLSEPGGERRAPIGTLLIAPFLLLIAIIVELLVVPAPQWASRLVGHNALACLASIPLLSLAPLAAILAALKRGAPTSPRLAGAVAGLAAGALGATLYAAHCTDDSPLFVATWYGIAILAVAALGAFAGSRLLRW